MQAIEFESETRNGFVKLPEIYKDWYDKNVKVILLRETDTNTNASDKQELMDFFKQFNADLDGYHFDREDANER